MSVRIICKCGQDITDQIPVYDKKTRSVDWMDRNPPLCALCADMQRVTDTLPTEQLSLPRRRAAR